MRRTTLAAAAALISLLLPASAAGAAAGDRATAFGYLGGSVVPHQLPQRLEPASDGSVYVIAEDVVSKLRPDGWPDAAFGTVRMTPSLAEPMDAAAHGTGLVVVAEVGADRGELRRYLPNGAPDPAFGTVALDSSFARVHVDGSDRILVVSAGRVTRYTAAGRLDPTFGVAGVATVPTGPLAVGPGGELTLLSEQSLHRLTPDGAVDPTFGVAGRASVAIQHWTFTDVVAAPDGRAFVAGNRLVDQTQRIVVAAIAPTGQFDRTYGWQGVTTTDLCCGRDTLLDALVLADGSLAAHVLLETPFGGRSALVRFGPNGLLDPGFAGRGWRLVSERQPVVDRGKSLGNIWYSGPLAVQPGGRLLVGQSGQERAVIYAFDG